MLFDEFFTSPEFAKYRKYQNFREVEKIFGIIESPASIDKMLIATDHGRPALEGIVEMIEAEAGPNFDIGNDKFLRQAVGAYVKFVLDPFGYEVHRQKVMNKGKIITSASTYLLNPQKRRKELKREFKIVDI